MTFDALLANLRHASTNWWKVNKYTNFIKFSCGLLTLSSCRSYFLLNKLKFDKISFSGRRGTRWQYGVPKWYDIVKRLGSPGVVESVFTFSFSPIPQLSQYHRPTARRKYLSPCSIKTPQYRVRKWVHEGKPRATNRLRVNPITVQCKVGNCLLHMNHK